MEEKTKDLGDLEIYEIGYHILPTVLEEDLHKEVARIHELISQKNGAVISEGAPQLKQLAYEMVKKVDTKNFKFTKAYFGWIKFEIGRADIIQIKEKMSETSNILRFIIIKTVRENTISISPKNHSYKKSEDVDQGIDTEAKIEIDEKEIDKSIDELVVNENV